MENQFFTMDMLKGLAGITACVLIIVQFTKGAVDTIVSLFCKLFKIKADKIPTAFWVVIVSEACLFTVNYFTSTLDAQNIFLTSINGLVISLAAMKSFESAVKSNSK